MTGRLRTGDLVYLSGLKDRSYNDHVCHVVRPVDVETGRAGVELHRSLWLDIQDVETKRRRDIPLAVKPENLKLCRRPSEFPETTSPIGTLSKPFLQTILCDRGWSLPVELFEIVHGYIEIKKLIVTDVTVSGCSSTRGDFPIGCVIKDGEEKWWISADGSFVGGEGEEHLEFSFGSKPRRIRFLGMRIPTLPAGPLSVRNFHLLAKGGLHSDWVPVTGELETLDRPEMQEFAIHPPIEATAVRLVCTKNAQAALLSTIGNGKEVERSCWCVGLFQVRFS